MRELTSHKVEGAEALTVIAVDQRGQGNAHYEYEILGPSEVRVGRISFQNGPIKEVGINGVSEEALLAILMDRLDGFQGGVYGCKENATTLDRLQAAMDLMQDRTRSRVARQVEGTSVD